MTQLPSFRSPPSDRHHVGNGRALPPPSLPDTYILIKEKRRRPPLSLNLALRLTREGGRESHLIRSEGPLDRHAEQNTEHEYRMSSSAGKVVSIYLSSIVVESTTLYCLTAMPRL